MKFNVTVDRDENGVWITECPSIPGCVSQGKTKDAALNKYDLEHSSGEDRWLLLGCSPMNGNVHLIAHTYRKTNDVEIIRIISVRKATRNEQETYYRRCK